MIIASSSPILLTLLVSSFIPALTIPLQGEEEVKYEAALNPIPEQDGMINQAEQDVPLEHQVALEQQPMPDQPVPVVDQAQMQPLSSLQVEENPNQDRSKRHLLKKKWGGGWGGGWGGKAWGGGGYGGGGYGHGGGGWGGGGHGGWGGGGLQISKVVVVPVKVVSGGVYGGGHGGYGGSGHGGWGGGGYGGGHGGGHGGWGGGGQGGWGGGGHGGHGGYGGGGCGGGCGGGGGGGSYSWSHASASSGSGTWGKKR